jgi:hypothetical protein
MEMDQMAWLSTKETFFEWKIAQLEQEVSLLRTSLLLLQNRTTAASFRNALALLQSYNYCFKQLNAQQVEMLKLYFQSYPSAKQTIEANDLENWAQLAFGQGDQVELKLASNGALFCIPKAGVYEIIEAVKNYQSAPRPLAAENSKLFAPLNFLKN